MDVTRLDPTVKQDVAYSIPLWLRDEQIKLALARKLPTVQPVNPHADRIALVCYGPSLNDTWEQIRDFQYVMTCSGAHRFLIDRGIVPKWHAAVDPLPKNTVNLIGEPHPDVEYMIAATCHPDVFDHLAAFKVTLWHVFDNEPEAIRTLLPPGEWALTGGCSVGVRMLTLARFLGFREQHMFGMDGSQGASGKHAGAHPGQPKKHCLVEYPPGSGVDWQTTPSMLETARNTWHELNAMPDVTVTFYGEGLVQAMAKDYVKTPIGSGLIGFVKDTLISAAYCDLNKQLHASNLAYGVGGGRHAPLVLKIAEKAGTHSILDYGAGKGYLAKAIPYPIWEYDPAIPGKDESPRPADLVVCTDVLEHIEPDRLMPVLKDLQRVTKMVGYFTIHTGPASKTLPDGRNTHLIQQHKQWWKNRLKAFFHVATMNQVGPELHCVVSPKLKAA